ncbi:MAG: hypothetical protein ABSF67_21640, partial [Roseiarcus sp.]
VRTSCRRSSKAPNSATESRSCRKPNSPPDPRRHPNSGIAPRRIAEAEVDLRRIRRARLTLKKLRSVLSTSFRLTASINSKLLVTAARLENRRKESSIDALLACLQSFGGRPGAREFVEAPLPPGARNGKPDALERYARRAPSRRKSALPRFDAVRRSERPHSVSGGA